MVFGMPTALTQSSSMMPIPTDETVSYSRRTRQIIRYRATANLRRPHIKQYTASNEGGGCYKTSRNNKAFLDFVEGGNGSLTDRSFVCFSLSHVGQAVNTLTKDHKSV